MKTMLDLFRRLLPGEQASMALPVSGGGQDAAIVPLNAARATNAGKVYIRVGFPDSCAHDEDKGVLWDKEGNCYVPIDRD